MKSVFVVVRKQASGPCGHGEPGPQYLALHHSGELDGYGWSLGDPSPAFASREAAERYRVNFDEWGSYRVIELKVVQEAE